MLKNEAKPYLELYWRFCSPNSLESLLSLFFLDLIRGIAALAVFFQHAGEGLWPEFAIFSHDWFNVGKFGVVIFFLTSGFVIPLSLEPG